MSFNPKQGDKKSKEEKPKKCLEACPDITDTELGKLLVQLQGGKASQETGNMIFHDPGEEQRCALSLLIFLKEKSMGKVKGQTCVNRALQREFIQGEDTTLPTVATDLVFLMGAVDAYSNERCGFP